jgi:hypothetical protein
MCLSNSDLERFGFRWFWVIGDLDPDGSVPGGTDVLRLAGSRKLLDDELKFLGSSRVIGCKRELPGMRFSVIVRSRILHGVLVISVSPGVIAFVHPATTA